PNFSMAPTPAWASTQSMRAPAARTTPWVAAITSGPMPSPGIMTTGVKAAVLRGWPEGVRGTLDGDCTTCRGARGWAARCSPSPELSLRGPRHVGTLHSGDRLKGRAEGGTHVGER